MRSEGRISCSKITWRGREAYVLQNGLIRIVTLTGGGHIAELKFLQGSGFPDVNPLWIPPWKTIEPFRYRAPIHASKYGSAIEGKLLSGLVGHNICLDYFGPPSREEAKQGLSTHGEAPSSKWRKTDFEMTRDEVALSLSVKLPVACLTLHREIKLRERESVVYFKETVINERKYDHFFHWTQHVTLGSPFASHRHANVTIPAIQGKTDVHGYEEGKSLLAPGRFFRWPFAPGRRGKKTDLARFFQREGFGFVSALRVDPARQIGFIAAMNTRLNLAMGYCFRRCDFPWVTVWEENRAIASPPWNGRTQARGLEFGSTPFPVLRREAFASGCLFDTPTHVSIPARGRKTIRYVAFLARTPRDFGPIRDVTVKNHQMIVEGRTPNRKIYVAARGIPEIW